MSYHNERKFISVLVCSVMCYRCESSTSWQDCDKHLTIVNCSSSPNEECVQQYQIKNHLNGTPIQVTARYERSCASNNHCVGLDTECQQHRYSCKARCCSLDLCNESQSQHSSYHWLPWFLTTFFIVVV